MCVFWEQMQYCWRSLVEEHVLEEQIMRAEETHRLTDCERQKYSQTCWDNHFCLSHTLQNQSPKHPRQAFTMETTFTTESVTTFLHFTRKCGGVCLSKTQKLQFILEVSDLKVQGFITHESFYKSKSQNSMQTADNGVCQKQL